MKTIYSASQQCSSDAETMVFFLKLTLQYCVEHYDPSTQNTISTRGLYGLIRLTLEQAMFFCTQVVQVPHSSKTEKGYLINDELKEYTTRSTFSKYRYFHMGVINDPNSAHYLLFVSKVNRSRVSPLLVRSAYQIFESTLAIRKIMFLNKLCAPMRLEASNHSPLANGEPHVLSLAGFKPWTSMGGTNSREDTVELIYVNADDFHRFVRGLTKKQLEEKFTDTFLPSSDLSLDQMLSEPVKDFESVSVKFNAKYLERLFEKNRKALEKRLGV